MWPPKVDLRNNSTGARLNIVNNTRFIPRAATGPTGPSKAHTTAPESQGARVPSSEAPNGGGAEVDVPIATAIITVADPAHGPALDLPAQVGGLHVARDAALALAQLARLDLRLVRPHVQPRLDGHPGDRRAEDERPGAEGEPREGVGDDVAAECYHEGYYDYS